MKLSPQQLRFYDTFGFLKFPGLFKDEIAQVEAAFEDVWAASGRTHDYKQHSSLAPFADLHEYLSSLLDDLRISGTVASILGDDWGYGGSDGNHYVGDTMWHSDHRPHVPYKSLKIAFYLDRVTADTGCLRVIPGSCHAGDLFTRTLDGVVPVTARQANEQTWAVHGSEVPAYAIESEPGDMLLFNHKTKHSSWGGGDRRRMFTYNFEERFSDEVTLSLHSLVRQRVEAGEESPYGEALLRTAGPERKRHLEQRLAAWEQVKAQVA